jgi:hypothetical protein
MNIKIAAFGIVAAVGFALASAQTCLAMGPIGPSIGPMSGSAPFVRASPWAGDVPGEPQGQGNNPWAQRATKGTELHFDLSQCQLIQVGLYKCSVADKPICNPDYYGPAECVRIGPKGSVFVSGFAD